MAPLPVPISRTRKAFSSFSSRIRATNSSVSGRGISTRSSTVKIWPQNSALPIIYWAGTWYFNCSKMDSSKAWSSTSTSFCKARTMSVKVQFFKARYAKERLSASSPTAINSSSYWANNGPNNIICSTLLVFVFDHTRPKHRPLHLIYQIGWCPIFEGSSQSGDRSHGFEGSCKSGSALNGHQSR